MVQQLDLWLGKSGPKFDSASLLTTCTVQPIGVPNMNARACRAVVNVSDAQGMFVWYDGPRVYRRWGACSWRMWLRQRAGQTGHTAEHEAGNVNVRLYPSNHVHEGQSSSVYSTVCQVVLVSFHIQYVDLHCVYDK